MGRQGAAAAKASVAEVVATAAVAAPTLSEDAGLPDVAMAVPPVSAAAGLHVTAKATSTVTAGAMPQVPPVKEPQPPDTEVLDEKTVRLAAALRTKYRREGGVVRIPVEQVGFHPKNRDGQPPNGSRCA